jgi:sugar/nucleoside kinase (ribokinase family)
MTMQALFIGHTYIDITFLTDSIPTGDQKAVADEYAVSFGGNAVTAAFCCAKLGITPHLITTLADDWLGRMFSDMAAQYDLPIHGRKVRKSSLSFIMPNGGKRAIVRCRDDDYLQGYAKLDLSGCRALHTDGHQTDAAMYYARECHSAGILTSLDGGGLRKNTHELLSFIDVAIVAERFCEQMNLNPAETLHYLKERGCAIGGVTMGERGLLWYDEEGNITNLPALKVPPSRVVDTSGAGDVFHGAYIYSYLAKPALPWAAHFEFARAASAHKIQHLGNEPGLPSLKDVTAALREFGQGEPRPARTSAAASSSSR